MPPTSNIQGNKCDTINGQNMPIQTEKHEHNSKSDMYKGLSQGNWTVSLTLCIYTQYFPYIPYIGTLLTYTVSCHAYSAGIECVPTENLKLVYLYRWHP